MQSPPKFGRTRYSASTYTTWLPFLQPGQLSDTLSQVPGHVERRTAAASSRLIGALFRWTPPLPLHSVREARVLNHRTRTLSVETSPSDEEQSFLKKFWLCFFSFSIDSKFTSPRHIGRFHKVLPFESFFDFFV